MCLHISDYYYAIAASHQSNGQSNLAGKARTKANYYFMKAFEGRT